MKSKILVYYTGTIGDTLVAFPSFQMIRQEYPESEITLLSAQEGKYSASEVLLAPTNYVDKFIYYRLPKFGIFRPFLAFFIIIKLRLLSPNAVIYLARDNDVARRERDASFFKYAGIKNIIGMNPNTYLESFEVNVNVAQRMVNRLAAHGIGKMVELENYGDLKLTKKEISCADEWFDSLKIPCDCYPIAWGMGGKQMANKWPPMKHREVLKKLAEEFKIYPIFFGDSTSREEEESIIHDMNCGIRAAVSGLSLRESIAAMRRCCFYCGHDTGTMHMAAAAGLRCIVIFSARNPEGKWYPLGKHHVCLRKHCECEGCGKSQCFSTPSPCIDSITVSDVFQAVKKNIMEIEIK